MISKTWIARLPLNLIHEASLDHEVPWTLLAAIVQTESAGDTLAARFEAQYKYIVDVKKYASENNISADTELVFQKTSWGLGQVMGGVARELGHQRSLLELLQPEIGLKYCCLQIKRLAKRHAERSDIIASYNAGSPIKNLTGQYKNQMYVDKVTSYLLALNETFSYNKK